MRATAFAVREKKKLCGLCALQTWMRNNDKTKARAEEREKNIGCIKRLFTAWRVSHTERTERRAERKEEGEDDSEEDEPVRSGNPVVSCHDAPEGDPSAGIIREGSSVRRESGPEQQHDWVANDRSGRQKTRPCSRRAQ